MERIKSKPTEISDQHLRLNKAFSEIDRLHNKIIDIKEELETITRRDKELIRILAENGFKIEDNK